MRLLTAKAFWLCVATVLAGCASAPPGEPNVTARLYDQIHRAGGDDTVRLLREGMKERKVYGVTQPAIPVRNNADVRLIWVPDYVDPESGRLVHGHWESTVLREGSWYID